MPQRLGADLAGQSWTVFPVIAILIFSGYGVSAAIGMRDQATSHGAAGAGRSLAPGKGESALVNSTTGASSAGATNNTTSKTIVPANRSALPLPAGAQFSKNAVAGGGWTQGATSNQPGYTPAREVQTTITTPNDYPRSSDFYYLYLSVYDSANSYDQIGIVGWHGAWLFGYSYTHATTRGGGICSGSLANYYSPVFSWVQGTSDSLYPNTQYTFALYAYPNGTIGFLYALGNSLKFLFNESYVHTGGTSFDLAQYYICNDGLELNYFADYTVYEEVEYTTQTVWPDWSFTFYDNCVSTTIGGTLVAYTYWSTFTYGTPPTGVTSIFVPFSSANVLVANQAGNLTLITALGSGKVATFYASSGSSISTPVSTSYPYTGGALATLSLFTYPSSWTYWFNPNSGTPSFGSTLVVNISSTATYGMYLLEGDLSWSSSDFTLVLFYVVVGPYGSGGGGDGGGGCVAWGTPVLQYGTTYAGVQLLGPGLNVIGYWSSNDTRATENITWNNFTWVNRTISINGGLIVTTLKDQPLYVKNGSWIGFVRDPQNLTLGEYLYNPVLNSWVKITSLQTLTNETPVFDLRENGPSTFVGGDPVLVGMKFDGSNEA